MTTPPERSRPAAEGTSRDRPNGSGRDQDEPPGDRDLRRMAVVLRLEAARRLHSHATRTAERTPHRPAGAAYDAVP